MSWNCERCMNPLVPTEFFSEGKFMVLKCGNCGVSKILEVRKAMLHAPANARIFLRNRIAEFMKNIKVESGTDG